jgi:hypothetical protein
MPPFRAQRALVLVWLATGCEKSAGEAGEYVPAGMRLSAASSASARPAPLPSERDRVTLDGATRPAPVAPSAGPRIYAKALRAWVHEQPSSRAARIGYLRAGASSPTRAQAGGTEGCAGGWYPVEPRGFVCAGATATLDANDPAVVLSRDHAPSFERKLPYEYGTVRNPGPIYARLPTRAELAQAEPDLEERMPVWLNAEGEIGASYGQELWVNGGPLVEPALAWAERRSDPLPELIVKGGMRRLLDDGAGAASDVVLARMRPKVGYSFLHSFLHDGRRYGLATDLSVMPTDRLRPIRGSDFHGVEIGRDITLPFAFVRRTGARYYRFDKSKNKLSDDGEAPYRAAVPLTGKRQFFRGRLHEETRDGRWLSDQDASRLDPAKRMPAWGKAGERWLDVNITKQTLVAYEGEKPVFATLVSTGEAGLDDHEKTTATKRGIFRVHTKHVSATMSSDEVGEEFELRDVPYVQYFEEGYALHGAYWHDRFGTPKSHGCINVSPEDARRLFFFTEPALPSGWHGVLTELTGTVVFVHP